MSTTPSLQGEPLPLDGPSDPGDGRVIVVGWQVLLIPVVVLAMLGGYWLGQRLRPAAVLQTAGADAAATPEAMVVPLDPNAPIIITLEPSQLQSFDSASAFGDEAVPLPEASHPLIGTTAPEFKMTLLGEGTEVGLADYRGQTVMINFWATWCPPCRLEMPWLESVYQKRKDQGFVLLAVDAGEKVPPSMVEDRIKQFIERMGLTFPVLHGDNTYDVQRDYNVYGLPATFIVDPSGTVVDFHNGMYPNEATLDAQVEKAVGEAAEG